jgi:hemolysin III
MYQGERFNSISHLIGVVLALIGATVLVTISILKGDPWRIVGFSVYGLAMISLYTISTLYHSLKEPLKTFFRRLDHLSIYLMIAGSYTPFTLLVLQGAWRWSIFGVVWGLAILGMCQELLIGRKTRRLSLIIYVLMGWLIVVAIEPMIERLPLSGLVWLSVGGLLYTGGIAFYVMDDRLKHAHGIWHLFVLGGSIAQFICLLVYVA